MISFFTAPQSFVTQVFIPWRRMEFPNSKSPIPEARHRSTQICSATRFHFRRLAGQRIWLLIFKDTRGWRLASCADGIAGGNANWTRGICIRKTDPSPHQTIEVRRINVRVTKCSDRIEPLLVGHDEQYVGPVQCHFPQGRMPQQLHSAECNTEPSPG